jgi:hypothetical protein
MELRHVFKELKEHVPFTALGAGVGIVAMVAVISAKLPQELSDYAFHILHPAHLLLSSIVTAAMFRLYRGSIGGAIAVGFLGAVAICTISDILLPHVGGALLGASMTLHLELLEHPWSAIVPGAVGATIGTMVIRRTHCPHAVHVLISTLASLFYLVAYGVTVWLPVLPLVFAVLFIAVWVPCCASDVIFPLIFVREAKPR